MNRHAPTTSCRVNGQAHELSVDAATTLADALRGPLALTGTRLGCEHGVCGACTVLVDARPARSCLMLAAQAQGREVTTVEGLTPPGEDLSILQEAFREAHGLQCGFCTSGMLLATRALLDENPDPDEEAVRDALHGQLCRCTGYQQIVEAVLLAAERETAQREAAQRADEAPRSTGGAR